MKKIALIVGILIFAGIGFVGCYTIKADVLPADYKGPAAERPILAPGDYWIYVQKDGGEVEWKFIRQEGDELVFEGGKPRDKKRKDTLYTNLDLIPLKRVHGKTGEIIYEKKGGDAGYLNFPLWIGGKWYFSYNVISRDFNIPVPLDHSCGVISYKKIAVRAGSFEAFEIRCNWKARGYDDSGQDTYWYAPKAKHIIKYETEKSPRELLEYEVK